MRKFRIKFTDREKFFEKTQTNCYRIMTEIKNIRMVECIWWDLNELCDQIYKCFCSKKASVKGIKNMMMIAFGFCPIFAYISNFTPFLDFQYFIFLKLSALGPVTLQRSIHGLLIVFFSHYKYLLQQSAAFNWYVPM